VLVGVELLNTENDVISTHLIFGKNLRELCRRVGTIAEVADALDINRVQMNRILNGESFPKPGLLKRICDYFSVDARILLKPLSVLEAEEHQVGQPNYKTILDYALYGRNYFIEQDGLTDILPNGIHLLMRPSFMWRNEIWVGLLRIFDRDGTRFMRGIDPVAPGMVRSDLTPICVREYRGTLLKSTEALSIIYAMRMPNTVLGVDHFSIRSWSSHGCLLRRCMIMSNANPIGKNVVPLILQPLEQNTSEILRAARLSGFRSLDDIPRRYREYLKSDGL